MSRAQRPTRVGLCALLVAVTVALPAGAPAEQATAPASAAAGRLDAGGYHTCMVLANAAVRCWGYGANGQLGYGNTETIGDDETPASVAPVNLGPGHVAKAISAGDYHTCALLGDGSVRCWGYGGDGRLGYGNRSNVTAPSAAGPVRFGPGHTAKAVSAGGAHTCAILDDGSVRCWGYGGNGRLGYASRQSIADPRLVGPVDLGTGRTAKAISAGEAHTCAILDDGSVMCWGYAGDGRLGYGNANNDVGDDETPASVGPVDLGPGRKAKAISAGGSHTCVILDDGSVRCWGYGGNGRLGYGNTVSIGDRVTPGSVGPVDLGPGRTAKAISAGGSHTCVILDDGTVRCWGYAADGQLGYGSTSDLGGGTATTPGKLGAVDLGPGRTAIAISAGGSHTCVILDDGTGGCWGDGANGRLGYCNENNVGDTPATLPGNVGPVNLMRGDRGVRCASRGRTDPLRVQAARAKALRECLAHAAGRRKHRVQRARAKCLARFGRTPGRITGLKARAISSTSIVLTFLAPGSDGSHPPAARAYLVKQSRRPIRGAHGFKLAPELCRGSCAFKVTAVGTKIVFAITHLLPRTTYYYAVAARDNVSGRVGRRSAAVKVTTP